MNKQGILTVISGFSGAGKGTVTKKLIDEYNYQLSISATTRKPRTGEENGREYFFKTKDEFEEMIGNKQLIEWAEYVGNYYGTPKTFVEKQLADGKNVILEIEMQGGMLVKEQFPDALLVFITPPTGIELKNRLTNRGTEDLETIAKRLKRASEESSYMNSYDYIVINDKIEECTEQIHQIIQNERCRVNRSNEFINKIKNELLAFEKGEL